MKKLAIGCAIVLVLMGVAASLVAYYVYSVVRGKVEDSIATLSAFKQVPELEREVRNRAEFNGPESGVLTQAQVDRFVAVQTAVLNRLGARFAEMERRYKTLLEKKEATALDMPELISAYRDLAQSWLDGKRAQVDALNAQRFSLQEYRWVRDRIYKAVGMPIMSIDVSTMFEQAMSGQNVTEPPGTYEGSLGPSGPIENQKLIEAHRKFLENNAPLAIFGL